MQEGAPVKADQILLKELLIAVPLKAGARWPATKPVPQPILVSLTIPTNVKPAAATDDLRHSIDYSKVCKAIVGYFANSDDTPSAGFTLELLASIILSVIFAAFPDIDELTVRLVQPKSPVHSKAVGIQTTWTRNESRVGRDHLFVEGLDCEIILGVNQCEREEKQNVLFDIQVEQDVDVSSPLDFRALVQALHTRLRATEYLTLEALASYAAETAIKHIRTAGTSSPIVTITASKPYALVLADSPAVKITRTAADYPDLSSFTTSKPGANVVAIAFGSNLGDRFANIELALRYLEGPGDFSGLPEDVSSGYLDIIDTSFLYESAPMYVEDQPSFINGALLCETDIPPLSLLKLLKHIESEVGRIPSIRNGPRTLDLDIIFYGNEIFHLEGSEAGKGDLVVPHPRLAEREFVLQPLSDMVPDFVHPVLLRTIGSLLAELSTSPAPLQKVVPFPAYPISESSSRLYVPPTHSFWKYSSAGSGLLTSTRIMATLNVTPDSFSDGSVNNELSAALTYAEESVENGADIIDVGGYSTRPGAALVTSEEEINRVVPTIDALRKSVTKGNDVLISVDTFRPEVARAAIQSGANCINDVYAFAGKDAYPFDPSNPQVENSIRDMKAVSRELAVPVVLMHSRGEAGSNKDYSMYEYAVGDGAEVVEGVRVELGDKVERIVKGKGGVRRWMVIVDPGIGFSKTVEANLAVLKRAQEVVAKVSIANSTRLNPLAGFPLLIGASKKSFLGKILQSRTGRETEPQERGWATATAVACAVQQQALVVRVHDVKQMRDVVTVAEALWS